MMMGWLFPRAPGYRITMQTLTEETTYQGDAASFVRQIVSHVLPPACLLSFCFFGPIGVEVFALFCLVSAPVVGLFYLFVRFWDRLSLDDDTGEVRLALRRLPYESITTFRVVVIGDVAQISVVPHWWNNTPLLAALSRKKSEALLRSLKRRCPKARVREIVLSRRVTIGLPLAVIAILYMGFHFFVMRGSSEAGVVCEMENWYREDAALTYGLARKLGGIEFAVPIGFEPLDDASFDGGFEFTSVDPPANLSVYGGVFASPSTPGLGPTLSAWPLDSVGLDTGYGYFRWVYCSRYGVLPLLLKSLLLGRSSGPVPAPIELWEIDHPHWRGLVKVDNQPGRGQAEILLSMRATEDEINFTLRQNQRIEKAQLSALIRGVRHP